MSGTVDEINGIAAIGIRSRALLYAASELHNERGQEDWVVAAEAAAEALKAALDAGFLIRDCQNYEGLDSGYYRIAVRTQEENERLIVWLRKL